MLSKVYEPKIEKTIILKVLSIFKKTLNTNLNKLFMKTSLKKPIQTSPLSYYSYPNHFKKTQKQNKLFEKAI